MSASVEGNDAISVGFVQSPPSFCSSMVSDSSSVNHGSFLLFGTILVLNRGYLSNVSPSTDRLLHMHLDWVGGTSWWRFECQLQMCWCLWLLAWGRSIANLLVGLWSVMTCTWCAKQYWWNFSSPCRFPSAYLSLLLYHCSAKDRQLLANVMDWTIALCST